MRKIKQLEEPEFGLIAAPVNTDAKDFIRHQAMILNHINSQSGEERLTIELLALKFKMLDYLNSDNSEIVTCGDFLRFHLNLLNVSQKNFAKFIEFDSSVISKILKGERGISPELSLKLGRLFPAEPLLWLEIEAKNELRRLLKINPVSFEKYSLSALLKNAI
jgi:plasmid maintenance system antidote protein VapI